MVKITICQVDTSRQKSPPSKISFPPLWEDFPLSLDAIWKTRLDSQRDICVVNLDGLFISQGGELVPGPL